MEYVQLLRVRRGLIVFAVANLFVLVAVTFALHGHDLQIKISLDKKGASFGDFLNIAGLGALFLATFFAGHLAAETPTLSFLFTKPVSRTALAVRYVAVDALGLLGGVAIGTLMLVVVVAGVGEMNRARLDAHVLPSLALTVGAALAWYGLCALAASRFDRDVANSVIALSWPVSLLTFMLSFVALPPPAHAVAVFLNQFDPFTYLLPSGPRDMGLASASMWVRAAVMWTIAVVSIAGATRLWTTREG